MPIEFEQPEITQAFLEEVIAQAPREFVGEPTHRGVLFYRNEANDSKDVHRKVLLNQVGNYWVSDTGSVWYADPYWRIYFSLPLIHNGEVVVRNGDRSLFELGQFYQNTIKVLTGEPPRQWTPQEMTRLFIQHASGLARYWETVKLEPTEGDVSDTRQRLDGLLFSILATLDGSSEDMPGFHLVSGANPEDRDYYEMLGDNWWPSYEVPVEVQLEWPLHDIFSAIANEPTVSLNPIQPPTT